MQGSHSEQRVQACSERRVQRQMRINGCCLAAACHRAQAGSLEGCMQPGQAVNLASQAAQAVLPAALHADISSSSWLISLAARHQC